MGAGREDTLCGRERRCPDSRRIKAENQGDQRTREAAQSQEEVGASSQPRKKGSIDAGLAKATGEGSSLEGETPWEKALPWEARGGTAPER